MAKRHRKHKGGSKKLRVHGAHLGAKAAKHMKHMKHGGKKRSRKRA